ncbi:HAD hydrolase-like protein [Candidatus Saccharibacteria bacterium]|nr:HAD family hydrolase [Candidatus Saccharibacteria bacterium]NIV03557.1 HAD hydrolase-like protein [Calditrichia bacterium]NIS38106.1 HAD family hydrolase [Candidatus Saccharibacteria bacterium]NIV71823.1 HAD hydrolase-like protein [Calditrichia bacterium]NIV98535.1 HAD hydrolase-like protein [Candidatus Saccharibacteria bacterium]
MVSFLEEYRFLIFTLNGVLVDHSELYELSFVTILEQYGIGPEISQRYYRSTAGTPVEERFKSLLPKRLIAKDPDLIDMLVQEYWESVTSVPNKLTNGVDELVRDLRQRAMLLFITEEEDDPEGTMLELGIYHYFSSILGPAFDERREEHICEFAKIAKLNVPRFCSQALMVSATVSDIEFATKMRIDSFGISTMVDPNLLNRAGALDTTSNVNDLLLL